MSKSHERLSETHIDADTVSDFANTDAYAQILNPLVIPLRQFPISMPPPQRTIANPRSKNARVVGALFFALGALLLYFCEIKPLQDAMNHVHDLGGKFSGKGAMAGFTCFIFGLALIIGGAPVMRFFNPKPGESKAPVIVAAILMMGGGLAIHFVTKSHIESLGYVFRFP